MSNPKGANPKLEIFLANNLPKPPPSPPADEQAELLFTRAYDWVSAHEEALSPQERGAVLESMRTLLVERATHAEPVAARDLVASLPLTESRPQEAVAELRQSFEMTLTAPNHGVDSIP